MIVARLAGIRVRISESLSMANKSEKKTYIKYALRPFTRICTNYYMACGKDCGIFQFGENYVNNGKVAIFKTVIDAKANVFDPVLRENTRRKFGWENNIVYGFIGRYQPQKNPVFLMEIFSEIAKRQPQAFFVTIGFGELETVMMAKANELEFADRYKNLGRREDIKQFYNAFDAFILPSLYEGLPVVGLESQSCGLPIFFSSEITSEASACRLGIYLSLDSSASDWAEKIIPIVNENMASRTSHSEDVIRNGFDSHSESVRLMNYYFKAIKETNRK